MAGTCPCTYGCKLASAARIALRCRAFFTFFRRKPFALNHPLLTVSCCLHTAPFPPPRFSFHRCSTHRQVSAAMAAGATHLLLVTSHPPAAAAWQQASRCGAVLCCAVLGTHTYDAPHLLRHALFTAVAGLPPLGCVLTASPAPTVGTSEAVACLRGLLGSSVPCIALDSPAATATATAAPSARAQQPLTAQQGHKGPPTVTHLLVVDEQDTGNGLADQVRRPSTHT